MAPGWRHTDRNQQVWMTQWGMWEGWHRDGISKLYGFRERGSPELGWEGEAGWAG